MSVESTVKTRRQSAMTATTLADNPVALENRIITRLNEYKALIYQTIYSFYKDAPSAYKYTADLSEELRPLTTDIQTLTGLLGKSDSSHLTVYQDKAYALELLVEIHTRLQDFDQALLTNELLSAVSCVHDTLSLLNGLSSCKEQCDPEIVALLKKARVKKNSALKACLHRYALLGVNIISNDLHTRMLVVYDITDPHDKCHFLSDLFSALAEHELKWIARQTIEHLIQPLLRDPTLNLIVERNRQQTVLTLDRQTSDTSMSTGQFIARDILCGGEWAEDNETFIEPFAEIWHHDLVRIITQQYLWTMIPDERNDIQQYMTSMSYIAEFEKELRRLGLLLAIDERPLSNYLQQSDRHYFEKRRTELLSGARDILTNDDQNTVLIEDLYLTDNITALSQNGKSKSGNDKSSKSGKINEELDHSLVGFPSCHVSVQTQTLIELVNQTLEDAANTNEQNDNNDSQHYEHTIYTIRSVLVYNDCMYIIFHLHMFEYRYGKQLAKTLLYWTYAHTHFCQLVQVESALRQVIQHVLQLVKSWRILLPKRLYDQTMAVLIDPYYNCQCVSLPLPTINTNESISSWTKFSQLYQLLNPSMPRSTRQTLLADTVNTSWSSSDKSILTRLVQHLS
ncbi:Centromere/kinetochore Zw10-domain-containing protein [Syncephalis plumigaleata]|nr:Centromere/kinetochore Zw10-domain-containing protein [Syncephalis plumigaleata]